MSIERVDTFSRNSAGTLIVNPRKLDIQSFWLTPDAPNNPVPVPAVAGSSSGPIICSVSQDGPFEAFYVTHERTTQAAQNVPVAQDVLVDFYDESSKLRLVNHPVHIDTIFGRKLNAAGPFAAGMLPHLLSETLWIHATRSIQLTFVNLGAASLFVWPLIHGRRFYGYANPSEEMAVAVEKRSARARLSTPFWMTMDSNSPVDVNGQLVLAGAGTGVSFFKVPTVGHFEWTKLMVVSTGAFRFKITDKRNGRVFTNDWIHVNAGSGAAPLPLILPEGTVLQPNSQLQFDTVDLSGAANTVYFTLAGRMIYVG